MIFYNNDLDPKDIEEIEREKIEEQDQYIQEQYDKGIIPDYKNNNNFNGNGKANNSNKILQQQKSSSLPIQNQQDFIEYVIKSIQKTVKCEDFLIRQILYTALSSYVEDDPINLGVLAPTSEGKTYAIIESLQYFPNEDVLYIGQMSPKVLVRQKGILIDKKLVNHYLIKSMN